MIHRFQFKVVPTPVHPQFHKVKYGLLYFWLHAGSDKQAAAHQAATILAELPYKQVSEYVTVLDGMLLGDDSIPAAAIAVREELVRESGMALLFLAVPVDPAGSEGGLAEFEAA